MLLVSVIKSKAGELSGCNGERSTPCLSRFRSILIQSLPGLGFLELVTLLAIDFITLSSPCPLVRFRLFRLPFRGILSERGLPITQLECRLSLYMQASLRRRQHPTHGARQERRRQQPVPT